MGFSIIFIALALYLMLYTIRRFRLWGRLKLVLRPVLDYPVRQYRLGQLIPTALALALVSWHFFTYGPFSGRAPYISQDSVETRIQAVYNPALEASFVAFAFNRASTALSDAVQKTLRRNSRAIAENLPAPGGNGWSLLTSSLALPYPVVLLPRQIPVITAPVDGPFSQPEIVERRISQMVFYPGSPFIRPDTGMNGTVPPPVTVHFGFFCSFDKKNCAVRLPTDVALQVELSVGSSLASAVLRFPVLTVAVGPTMEETSEDVVRAYFPELPPTNLALETVEYINQVREPVQLIDASLAVNGEANYVGTNPQGSPSPTLRMFPVSVLDRPEIVARWQPHDFGTAPRVLESCVAVLRRSFVDLSAAVPDFEDRQRALCTVSSAAFKTSVRRCASRQTAWQKPARICDFSRRVNPSQYTSRYRDTRYYTNIGPVSGDLTEQFTFDRREDRAFLTLLWNMRGRPEQPILLPEDLRQSLTPQIIADYATILGPSTRSPAMNAYIASVDSEVPDWPFAKSNTRQEVLNALARQPHLYTYYDARAVIAPVIYEKLFADLTEMGLYPLSDTGL